MPCRFELNEFAVADPVSHVPPDRLRRDDVVRALQDERLRRELRQVGAIVRQEGHAREVLRYLRVGAAEAVREFLGELRAVSIAHDDRGHGTGPAEMVRVEELDQTLDVLTLETA